MKYLKKMIVFLFVTIIFSGCFFMTEEDISHYSIEKGSYPETPDLVVEPPESITVLGQKLSLEFVDNFDYEGVSGLEANWETHKNGAPRRGANFWDDAANEMKKDANGNSYFSIVSKEIPFKDMGIALTEEYKKLCNIEDENGKVLVSNGINTLKPMQYGLFVGRLKVEKETTGHWQAFWHYNDQYEFDIFEYHSLSKSYPINEEFAQTTHYNHANGRNSYYHFETVPNLQKWNTYAVLWTPEEYVYYVNWEPTYFVRKDENGFAGDASAAKENLLNSKGNAIIPDTPAPFFFSTEIGKGVTWAELWAGRMDVSKLPDSLDVDYFAWYTNDSLKQAAIDKAAELAAKKAQ